MKKIKTLLVAGMAFLFTNLHAQSTEVGAGKAKGEKKSAETYLNLMLNMVSTNLNYGGSNSILSDFKKPVNGLRAGVSFQAGITPRFSLVTEFYFIRKGGKLKVNNPLYGSESVLRLNTLELPVLARVHIGKFYVNAGPSVTYNISGSKRTGDQSIKLSFNNTNEGFHRFEAGIQIGGGFGFPVKQKRIALDIRYGYGLTNIANGQQMHNRALMISVHFSKKWKTNPLERK